MAENWQHKLQGMADMVAAPMSYLWSPDRTASEIKSLQAAARKSTQTNCWWATFRAAEMILAEAPRVLEQLERDRAARADEVAS